jgi:hypothetical protein
LGTRPGLLPVMQVTLVIVAAVDTQATPSIRIVYFVKSLAKLLPVKVSCVPPLTVPNLGSMLYKRAVKLLEYPTIVGN